MLTSCRKRRRGISFMDPSRCIGWVERSETHQRLFDPACPPMGFASLNPSYNHGKRSRHRHLLCRRSVAFEGRAAHVAHLARIPVAAGPMHGLTIIPHHEIILPPGVSVDELP